MDHVPAPRSDTRLPLHTVEVQSVPKEPPIHIKFLGPLRGLLIHWTGRRSVPCHGEGHCPSTIHRKAKDFKAYAAAQLWVPTENVWRAVVFEATGNAEMFLRHRQLRAEVWLFRRENIEKKNSEVLGAYCETLPLTSVPEEFDIEPVLFRVFHCATLNLGIPNPMPPKLLLADLPGPAPITPVDLLAPVERVMDGAEKAALKEQLEEMRRQMGYRAPGPERTTNRNGHAGSSSVNGNGKSSDH